MYGRTLSLTLAMVLGGLLPQAQVLSPLVPYLLMIMLFFSFLDVPIRLQVLRTGVVRILVANILIALLAYFLLRFLDPNLAIVAFITGIAPTATAAPVIIGFLEGQVDYVIASVVLTNVCVALLVPFLLPVVVGTQIHISSWEILPPVLAVIAIPLGLTRLVPRLPSRVQTTLRQAKTLSFPIWMFNLFVVTSKASAYLHDEVAASLNAVIAIALIALGICIVNFGVGARLGGRAYRQEASQALGQKNNSFSIWLALTFISPLAALGPTFYVVYHNLYNSYQLYRFGKRPVRDRLIAAEEKQPA